MESISPNIFVNDMAATVSFYSLLGFNVVTTVPETGDVVFTMMSSGNAIFMFQTFKSIENSLPVISRTNGGSLLLYIKMTGIREYFNTVKAKVNVLTELETTFYGATEFSLIDNNNYMLTFAEDE